MTLKDVEDPKWVEPFGHALTALLGSYFCLRAVADGLDLAIYIIFAQGGDVTLPKKLLAIPFLILIMAGARMCGVAARKSWHQLKLYLKRWQRREAQ